MHEHTPRINPCDTCEISALRESELDVDHACVAVSAIRRGLYVSVEDYNRSSHGILSERTVKAISSCLERNKDQTCDYYQD
jgi:hypothetical protein